MKSPCFDFHTHLIKAASIVALDCPQEVMPEGSVCSLMLHPWNLEIRPLTIAWKDYARLSEVKVIGEVGLDKACAVDWGLQLKTFAEAVELANQLEKPLIVHCVRAHEEAFDILSNYRWTRPVIFHRFNRSVQLLERLMGQGFWVSFGEEVLSKPDLCALAATNLTQVGLESDEREINMNDFYCRFAAKTGILEERLLEQMACNFNMVIK